MKNKMLYMRDTTFQRINQAAFSAGVILNVSLVETTKQ